MDVKTGADPGSAYCGAATIVKPGIVVRDYSR